DPDEDGFERKLTHIYDADGRLLPLGEWWYRLGGADVKAGMTRPQATEAAFRAAGRTTEANGLGFIAKIDELTAQGKQEEALSYTRLFYNVMGIYDRMDALTKKWESGQITEV